MYRTPPPQYRRAEQKRKRQICGSLENTANDRTKTKPNSRRQ